MAVVVDFHQNIQPGLTGWVLADPARAADRLQLWRAVYRPDIEATLAATGGDEGRLGVIGASRCPGLAPPVYDWPYSADLWVRFVVRVRRVPFRSPAVRITVLLISHEQPAPPGP
jgi:hypothetical protein